MHEELPKKRPTVLTRLRIDEVSLVDRAAGEGCKIVISKRDDSDAKMPTWQKRYWQEMGASPDFIAQQERECERIHGTGHADHGPEDEPENPYLKSFRGFKTSESSKRALAKVAAELNKGNDADDDDDGLKRDGREAIADIVEDALDQDDDGGKPAADGGNDHPAQRAADLLVEAGKFSTR